MTLTETFAAARARIASGMFPPRLFKAQDWTPGPGYGRDRPQTFGERRAAYATICEDVRRIEAGARYMRQRSLIIDETPQCRAIIAAIRQLENLPFGMSMEREAAPLRAELETIIAARMAEVAGAQRAAA